MIKTDNSKVIENLEKRIQETKERLANINKLINRMKNGTALFFNSYKFLNLNKKRKNLKSQLSDLEQWLMNIKDLQKKKCMNAIKILKKS
jgi:ferritin-like metal-binding protein YciE